MDFAILADHTVKIKESKMMVKYLDIDRELKKQWKMRLVMVIAVAISTLEMILKGLKKRLEEEEIRKKIKTIQIPVLLRLAKILRSVLESWRVLLSPHLQWKTTSTYWCKRLAWCEVGKEVYWNLCKIMKFEPNKKWYMLKPESALENETYKRFWDTNRSPNPDQKTRGD